MSKPKLAIRILPENPDHHLWNNHGTWWLHCTVHLPGNTSARLRRSLKTVDVVEARRRRDRMFIRLEGERRVTWVSQKPDLYVSNLHE